MRIFNLKTEETNNRNKHLEKENQQVREKIFRDFLNKNTTANYFNFRINELEKENQLLRQQNNYLKSMLTK